MNRKRHQSAYFVLIILYGLILIAIMTGSGNLYGSKTDWLSQHIVFPELFRESFYESGQLIPNFLFQVGGGQNAFHFTYYGFLSPIILFSYLLPFVDMTTYMICASIFLYLATGILVFVFLKHHFGEKRAFLSALIYLTLSPVNYHFHHHIMFVWYLPSLMLALIGLDRYFENRKRILFIVSVFCMILTSYYFSVGSLVCLFAYAVYNILKEENCRLKYFIRRFGEMIYLFLLPVLLSAFVLLPTAYALVSNSRSHAVSESIEDLLLPNLQNSFFDSFSMGITGLMFVAVLGNLTSKGLKKCDVFLHGFLILLIICPIFAYVLNGMLYVRGKVLIPFAILFVYALCLFIEKLERQEICFKRTAVSTILVVLACGLINKENRWICLFILLGLAAAALFRKRPAILYVCTIGILVAASWQERKSEEYVSEKFYDELYSDEIEQLMETIAGNESDIEKADNWYRTNISYRESQTVNRSYGSKFYGTSVYSSTSNRLYQDFYENYMGNNERYRNCFLTTGARNELFYTFMGNRYIVGQNDPGFYYEKVAEGEHLNLYENQVAYPMIYKSNKTMSEAEFDKMQFPYSTEQLLTHTVVADGESTNYQSVIEPCDVAENYQFIQEETETYEINLDESYCDKLLYLTFDIANEGDYKNKKDISIRINGVKNTLTASTALYYNGNTQFDYVISLEDTTTLTIEISKGLYDIQNLRMYTSPVLAEMYEEAENLELDAFSGEISCSVQAEDGEYLVTTIPYDKGFSSYINGEPAKVEVVNKAFVGIRLKEGENKIVIKYTSPFFHAGVAVSLLGLIFLGYELIKTKAGKRK